MGQIQAISWAVASCQQEPRQRKAGSLQIRTGSLSSGVTVEEFVGPIPWRFRAREATGLRDEHVLDNSPSAH
jgi:hypothetical protein